MLQRLAPIVLILAAALPGWGQVRFTETFENVGPTQGGAAGPSNLIAQGWIFRNQSQTPGINVWREGDYIEDAYVAQSGSKFLTTASSWDQGTRQVSVWAIVPPVAGQQAGDQVSVFARGWVEGTTRVQLRYSPSGGTGTGSGPGATGDFSVLLGETALNPNQWSLLNVTVPGAGRLAVRAFEPQVGQFVSPIISVDSLTVSGSTIDPPLPGPGETVTWTAAMSPVQIRSPMTIPAGGTVIVEPGVTVNVQQQATLHVHGTLRGLGTQASPVTITAAAVFPPAVEVTGGTLELAHAVIGGQLRPNAGSTILIADSTFNGPNGLIFSGLYIGTGYAQLDRCTFNNSELTISNYTVVLNDLTLNNTFSRLVRDYVFFDTIVSDGRSVGFLAEDVGQPILVDTLTVRNVGEGAGLGLFGGNFFIGPDVTLENNQYPVSIESAGLLPGSRLPPSGNTDNRVFVPGGDHGGQLIWADPGIPYYISAYYAQHGGSILILPGVTVQIDGSAGIAADPADIRAMGTQERPIVFERSPGDGPWFPLQLFRRIRHGVLDGALRAGAWPSCCGWGFVDSSIVRGATEFGLTGQVIVRKTLFENNAVGASVSFINDLLGDTNPNAFEGNGVGVSAASNATHNWWGSPTGPTTPSNPGGTGDPVASGVPYEPFRTSRPDFGDAPPIVDLEKHSFLARPGERMILTWHARDDGSIVSQRIVMALDGEVVQGNLIEPVIVLAEDLPGTQRSIEFVMPEPSVRFFGSSNIRVEATDDAGQVGWDDLFIYSERDEPGQLVLTSPSGGTFTAGQSMGPVCWNEDGINPIGGSVDAALLLENTGEFISLGGVTTYLNCLALDLSAPFASTDRARIVLSLFTGGGVSQPEYFYGPVFAVRPDARVGDAPPAVDLTAPTDGGPFPGGTVVPIRWTASDDQFVRAFHVQFSTDGGRTWSFIVRDLPGTATGYDWRLPPSTGIPEVRIKVVAVDRRFQDSSDIHTIAVAAGSGVPVCPVDWNGDSAVNSADISAFLGAWLASLNAGDLAADFNGDGATNSTDISAFLSAWLAAVTNGC